MKKKYLVLLFFMIFCLVFAGCKNYHMAEPGRGCGRRKSYAEDEVSVYIKQEYKQEFLEEQFTVSDFDWENIREIRYGHWNEKVGPEYGYITIYLKKTGLKRVEQAVEHFYTLEFVARAEKISLVYAE